MTLHVESMLIDVHLVVNTFFANSPIKVNVTAHDHVASIYGITPATGSVCLRAIVCMSLNDACYDSLFGFVDNLSLFVSYPERI